MFKNEKFRLALISLIFSASVLVILPRINLYVSNRLLKVDSFIGGYSVNLFGKVIDLNDFKKGIDVGGMKRLLFTIGDAGTPNIDATSQQVKDLTVKRMAAGGYKDYQVYISKVDGAYKLAIEVPTYVDITNLSLLTYGTGNLTFKTLKNPSDWKPENVVTLAKSPDAWLPTGISRNDISNLIVTKGSTGQDQLQVVFTSEGKVKFNQIAKQNVNKPVAFYINDQDNPILIPVIDASLAENSLIDPTLTGNFPQGFLTSYLIQYNNGPLPVILTSPRALNVAPKFGNDFLAKFGLAMLAGFGATVVLSLIRFKKKGVLFSLSVFFSIVLFVAIVKVFAVPINFAVVVGMLATLILFAEKGYEILYKIKLEESEDKPLEYVLEKVFMEQGDVLKYVTVILFFTMLLVSKLAKAEISSFVYSILIGCLCLPYFYFVLRSMLETYKRRKK